MHLIIDIGNSFVKIAILKTGEVIFADTIKEISPDTLKSICDTYEGITNSIISSVSKDISQISAYLNNRYYHLVFNHNTPIPISNTYRTPDTLGLDRLAAVVGAYSLYPNNNNLVIDAGTALTFDIINNKNEYLGGTISPGISMRFKALNNFTEKLPLCSLNQNAPLIGTDTQTAIESGVQNGILMEIEGYISAMKKEFSNLKVFLTGGDTFFFDKKLKNTIFAEPLLVIKGLNRIIEYNARQT